MIQRIQSVYLFLVVCLGTVLCCFPVVHFVSMEGADEIKHYVLQFSGLQDVTNNEINNSNITLTISFSIISIVIPLLALVDIFLYRRRILQARLNVITVVLCVGWYAMAAVYVYFFTQRFRMDWYPTMLSAIPLINLVLTLMATRAILKDEALVRAADRLR